MGVGEKFGSCCRTFSMRQRGGREGGSNDVRRKVGEGRVAVTLKERRQGRGEEGRRGRGRDVKKMREEGERRRGERRVSGKK